LYSVSITQTGTKNAVQTNVAPLQAVEEEFSRNGRFQKLALRYVQAQLTLSTQNAACNAMHTYEQRLARWLLICCDRAGQNHLEMAQEFVSQMLGAQDRR
jgi:CRP-like cAMP-binding protein